jgi:hypothetical protein
MKRIRSKRQRRVGFEALEGRLALSAGVGMAVASHHAEILARPQIQKAIPASFRGHAQVIGNKLVTTNLTGTIGRDRFTGSATGTLTGKLFEGGEVSLSNSQGSVEFSLGAAFVVKVGRTATKQEVSLVAVGASGKYAPYLGTTGTLTTWNLPSRPGASASFSGTLSP